MKKFLITALFATTIVHADAHEHEDEENLLEEAPVVLAGINEIKEYKKTFEHEGAVLGKELVGFKSLSVPDTETKAVVYNIPEADKLKDSQYDCHFHEDENGDPEEHCVEIEQQNLRDYTAAAESFSVDEFEKAANSSIKVFKDDLNGDPKKIKEAKFWRSFVNDAKIIQIKYVWVNTSEDATNYIYCHEHQHGNEVELDCHRGRPGLPGLFEP